MKYSTLSFFQLGGQHRKQTKRKTIEFNIDFCFFRLSLFIRIWNVDGAVARKVVILWAFFMYVGQATKDIVEIPRPRSPPVIHLEKRFDNNAEKSIDKLKC